MQWSRDLKKIYLTMLGFVFLPIPNARCELPEGFTGVRPAGLGGAFTAVASDENSFFTNPAGVARVRKARSRSGVHIAKFPNPMLGINAGSRSFYALLKGTSSDGLAEAIENTTIDTSKPFYARLASFPVVMFEAGKNRPMGLAGIANSVSKVFIDKEQPTDARVVSVSDVGVGMGYGMTNFANRLNLGITVRPTYRYAFEDTLPVTELKQKTAMTRRFRRDSNRGLGIGADLGMMFTLADFWFPTVGVAIRNLPTGCQSDYLNPYTEERQKICGTKYSVGGGNPDALSNIDPTDVRAGVSISPRFAKEISLRFSADIHNLYMKAGTSYYGLPGVDVAKLIHGGIELFSGNPLEQPKFSLRLGANQGFITYGMGLNLGFFHADFASYGVDISEKAKRVEDRRYLGSLGFVF